MDKEEEAEQGEFLQRENEEFDEATLTSTHLSSNYNDLLRGEFQGRPVTCKIAGRDLNDPTFYLREKLVDFVKHCVLQSTLDSKKLLQYSKQWQTVLTL